MKQYLRLIAFAFVITIPSTVVLGEPEVFSAEPRSDAHKEIVERLEEIVSIYEVPPGKLEALSARGLTAEYPSVDLIEARIELAKEKREFDIAIQLLMELEILYQRRLEATKMLVDLGRAEVRDVSLARLPVLKTQIRILRMTGQEIEQGEGGNSE